MGFGLRTAREKNIVKQVYYDIASKRFIITW